MNKDLEMSWIRLQVWQVGKCDKFEFHTYKPVKQENQINTTILCY